jgi:hypothetical protein
MRPRHVAIVFVSYSAFFRPLKSCNVTAAISGAIIAVKGTWHLVGSPVELPFSQIQLGRTSISLSELEGSALLSSI